MVLNLPMKVLKVIIHAPFLLVCYQIYPIKITGFLTPKITKFFVLISFLSCLGCSQETFLLIFFN